MIDITRELSTYRSALILEKLFSMEQQKSVRRVLLGILLLLALVVAGFVAREYVVLRSFTLTPVVTSARVYTGLFLLVLIPTAILYQLSFFYNTLRFRGHKSRQIEDYAETEGVTLNVARILDVSPHDLTSAFLSSQLGKEVLFRLGIEPADALTYLRSSRQTISVDSLPTDLGRFLTTRDLGEHIIANDASFKDFLFKHGTSEEAYRGALAWILRIRGEIRFRERWWGRDRLGRIPGIGDSFSYGVVYELRKFTRELETTSAFSLLAHNSAYANELITKIETILARIRGANVLLVGESGTGPMDLLIELGKRMREGRSVASVTGKRLVVFDTDSFSSTYSDAHNFERAFLKLMNEVDEAGNIILVIEDLVSFLERGTAVGVNLVELLERYLVSSYVQIIAVVRPEEFHGNLSSLPKLGERFEAVFIESPDLGSTIRVLEDAVWKYEYKHKVFFSYQSLVRIAESAEEYIVDGVMPDKAVTLLAEVAARAATLLRLRVTEAFVDETVSKKTGIPSGTVDERERELLLHLEDLLHERVIGQSDAIKAIASTMRRSRVGIESKERPIGSFLFLGSTGVGKTETAKALAHVFFGSEERMLRFDMSEFSNPSALAQLIGDRDTSGVLSAALHDHPYGVVLLDEFEKASSQVHDLFLQILDEGHFTSGQGKHVNVRNAIFIATSNAGSDRIWELVRRGERPSLAKDNIIQGIIREGIFKPELLNRFDSVIIFESLKPSEQRKIAELMLRELKERIARRGFDLEVNDLLIDAVAKEGADPEFGARPMRRAIQDVIEEKIALQILEKRLSPGDRIVFTAEELR